MKLSAGIWTLVCGILLVGVSACSDAGPAAAPAVASVQISAAQAGLVPGNTQTLTATALDASGAPVSGATIAWSSSDTAVVTVSGSGVVTAVRAGTARVRAASGGVSASVEFTIAPGGVVSAAGGTVTTPNNDVTLTFPAGALPVDTKITVAPRADSTGNEHAIKGLAYEFGPDGTKFPQPVTLELKYDAKALPADVAPSALRVAHLVNGNWEILGEGAAVDSASGKVRASIRSFSSYGVVAEPCAAARAQLGATLTGSITANDCVDPTTRRHIDYVTLPRVPAGEMYYVSAAPTATNLLMGVKSPSSGAPDLTNGTVWLQFAVANNMPLRVLGDGRELQLYVMGRDSTVRGSYSLTLDRRTGPVEHSCSVPLMMTSGTSLATTLTQANACQEKVEVSPLPQAVGKPIWSHFWYTKLEPSRSYTFTIEGLSSSFSPSLTVYEGSTVKAQAVNDGTGATSRSITVTTPAGKVTPYIVEVSSGTFTDRTYTTWINQSGSYTFRISQ